MAKSDPTVKRKKQGFVQRMMFGDDTKPDLDPDKVRTSKWAMFKFLFFSRFGTMVALNLLTALFALPAIAVMVLFYLNSTVADGFVPYSASLGMGYPIIVGAAQSGIMTAFSFKFMEYLILIPCIAVFALGVSGNLYVMRKLIWDEQVKTFKDFFRGIKKCWVGALLIGIAFGFTTLLLVFSFGYFDAYKMPVSLKAVSLTLTIVLFIFMILYTAFFMTQNAAFKMRPIALLKNSLLFVVGTNIQAIVFIGIAIAPAFTVLIPGFMTIFVMLYAFLGFSFSTLVISLYCHHCYEKFLYDKIEGPATSYARKASESETEQPDAAKKKAPVAYKNPKKRKKSIDEGSSITPLTPTFRREDLERLEREHAIVMNESAETDEPTVSDDGDGQTAPPPPPVMDGGSDAL